MEQTPRKENSGNEYASILSNQLTTEILMNFCLRGGLRTSTLRSVAWRIHLKCLPISKVEWVNVTTRARNLYASLKQKNIPNPHDDRFCQDPQVNNPLAQADHNPWQQYFADHDLRDLILKDVGRTFPELEFFQQDHIRRMMCDILLIYAKENPFVSYKQGMHEILAPLMFVLYSDQQTFHHCLETGGLKGMSVEDLSILSHLYDPEHLESDSYGMFCEVMLEVAKWYEDGTPTGTTLKPFNETQGPYMRVQDATPTSPVMRELSAIGDRLHSVDPMLSNHLSTLDIPPQLYGIRWLRLLFGREFAIHDLLYVWDVLWCDRPVARMVECVFVTMLVQIRHLLLQSDYGGCLQYLMRYPPIVDVSTFIQQALHYRNPKKYAKPATINSLGNFTHLTVTGADHPNRSRQGVMVNNEVAQDEPPGSLRNITSSMLSKVKNSVLERPSLLTGSPPLTPRRMPQNSNKSPSWEKVGATSWEKELRLMEEQVACLQIRLNEKDVVCLEAARNIESCVEQLRKLEGEAVAGLCTKLLEISSNLTASTVSSVGGNPVAHRRNDDEVIERRNSVHRAPPQPRHIQRENEMIDLRLRMTK